MDYWSYHDDGRGEEATTSKNKCLRLERIKNRCRGCLRIPKVTVQLSATPQQLPLLSIMFLELLNIKVPPDRTYPQILCIPCASTLCTAYTFREKCLQSHKKLTELFDQTSCRYFPPSEREHSPDLEDETTFRYETIELPSLPRIFEDKSSQTQPLGDHCSVCKLGPYTSHCSKTKSITCSYCEETFTERFQLKKHTIEFHKIGNSNEHSKDPLTSNCLTCGKKFKKYAKYKKHIESCSYDQITKNNESLMTNFNPNYPVKVEYEDEAMDESVDTTDASVSNDFTNIQIKPETLSIEMQNVKEDVEDWEINSERPDYYINSPSSSEDINADFINDESKIFSCIICKQEYATLIQLEYHSTVHDEDNKFTCPVCGQVLFSKGFKKRHILTKHAMKADFQCDVCKKLFGRKMYLEIHLKRHCRKHEYGDSPQRAPREKDLQYFCSICGRGFVRKKSLKDHLNTHDDEKATKCHICDKRFHNKWQLNAHVKAHSPKAYLCPHCGQNFGHKETFRVHVRRHTGDNPYKCKFCDKGFVRMSDVRAHEKYHTGDRSHICPVCNMGFTRNYSLKVHMRKHTGEKPHACDHCGKRFAQAYDMKLHVRRHTGEGIKCDLCGENFIQIYLLRQHKQSVHGIEESSRFHRLNKIPDKSKDSGKDSTDLQNEC